MVRERFSNRTFRDDFIRPLPPPATLLDLDALFRRRAPLELDLGCGRGRFLLARAATHPDRNFIGIDRVLLRLRKLDLRAGDAGVGNIRLFCGDAASLLSDHLPPASVTVCYVFFPDPWPKRRHHPRRLLSAAFTGLLHRVLAPEGCIHMATDHMDYFAAIRRLWDADPRFERTEPYVPTDEEETDFGLIFRAQGRPTGRCSYRHRSVTPAG